MKVETQLTDVVEQHTSQAAQNSCANAKIWAFFQTGALLGNDNYCYHEAGAFGVTLPQNLEKRDDWKDARFEEAHEEAIVMQTCCGLFYNRDSTNKCWEVLHGTW